jgi:ABC-2 type transport system ATP-binding protein
VLGHVHDTDVEGLTFPRRIYDELISDGGTKPHGAGFAGVVSYHIGKPEDVPGAVELFRMNYERAKKHESGYRGDQQCRSTRRVPATGYGRHRPWVCPQSRTRRLTLQPIISVSNLSKTYPSGFQALKKINLEIHRGEIFALLGPNGAGKTTLISIICGIVNLTEGVVRANGHDIVAEYRAARSLIGLVPQELTTDAFETVWSTVTFSRGLFGKPANPGYIEKVLRDLSLWDKKDSKIMTLSGGMKRRVMIAKALSHEPQILFLDEPTAGVDVELRQDMWQMVRSLRETGVTIILTTHYIHEAEEMADRIGVISNGELIVVEDKAELMRKLGKKQLTLQLHGKLDVIPSELAGYGLELAADGSELIYTYDTQTERTSITALLANLIATGIEFKDLQTKQSSLEDIFVSLVKERR